MPAATIHKDSWPGGVIPNVVDYDVARSTFSWDQARQRLDGLPGGRGLNIAYEAVDRHAFGPIASRTAFRWLRRDGTSSQATYAELAALTNRFANVLDGLGVGAGDRVFTLLGRVAELYTTCLGTLKHRSVFSPLFSAFGPEPIRQRLARGDGRVLVTTPALYRRRVAAFARCASVAGARAAGGRLRGPDRWHGPVRRADGRGIRRVHHRADLARRHGVAALHERDDR